MNQFLTLFRGVAGLVIAGVVAVLLFTFLGGLLIAAGLLLAALVVGGGIYALVTGRRVVTMKTGTFEDIRIYDPRARDPRLDDAFGQDMIDVTPPKDRRGRQ